MVPWFTRVALGKVRLEVVAPPVLSSRITPALVTPPFTRRAALPLAVLPCTQRVGLPPLPPTLSWATITLPCRVTV